MTAPSTTSTSRAPRSRAWSLVAWTLLAAAFLVRVLPFLEPSTRLLRQYPTEDGYLMLTIGRNLALGNGMSTAEGTIPTNGTQPLATFLYAAGYALFDGGKVAGVAFALVLQVLAGLATVFALHRLARRLLASEGERAGFAAGLAAVLWYVSPLATAHGLNCLETGFYGLAVVLFADAFLRRHPVGGGGGYRRALEAGACAGLVLWVRLDAVFLLAAACLAWAFLDGRARLSFDRARFLQASALGVVATLVIAPWLVHNRIEFGSFMPISGRAESWAAGFGSNLPHLAAVLAEYVLLVVQIPARLELHPAVVAGGAVVAVAFVALVVRALRGAPAAPRLVALVVGLYALGMCGYYGLVFGAPWFLSRYFFPLSAFTAIVLGAAIARGLEQRPPRAIVAAAAALVVAAATFLHVRTWRRGLDHQHLQVVEWVTANVPESTWVAAVQTGTVGYFHDRTINLDGKVNPEALAAVLARRIPQYVLGKPVEYIADWEGVAGWAELPEFEGRFEVLVHDREKNLAVLRRKDAHGR
ncbi:MAG: hypothetical protein IPJ77_05660 [Planctomycetes bacterium]|nr:hypothetical protein [Planctomycetota bacterium]